MVGLECSSGFCENEAWFAEGTCSPRLAEDDACPNGGCPDTHYCDGTCRPDSALGEACDEFPEIFAPTNFGDIYGIHDSCAIGRCAYLGGATVECATICDGI